MYQSKAQVNSVMVKIKIKSYAPQKAIKYRFEIHQSAAAAHHKTVWQITCTRQFRIYLGRVPLHFFLQLTFR